MLRKHITIAHNGGPHLVGKLAAIGDLDLSNRAITRGSLARLNSLDDFKSLEDLAEHNVLAIQPRGHNGSNEKLGPIGVGTGVSHRQKAGFIVLELEVLISKLGTIDGLTTSAIALSKVPP